MSTQVLERPRVQDTFRPERRTRSKTSSKFVERDVDQSNAEFPTILIVEDEPLIRDIMAEVLHGAGFMCIQTGTAEDAMQIITDDTQRVDLIIADVNLPGIDGHEMIQRARDYRPSLKVLFVTGNPADGLLKHDFKDRNTDLLTKPFRLNEVTDHVSAML